MELDGKSPKHVNERCFAMVVREFLASPKFQGDHWAASTKEVWARYLNLAARPNCLGAVQIADLRPALVQAFVDGLSGKPGVQQMSLSALRVLEKWAIVRDILCRPITLGVETEDSDGGHMPWNQQQVELAEKYARADFARMVTLGANTGQRGSDLVRMGWSDIESHKGERGICVTQQKTGRHVFVPITDKLSDAMRTWEKRPGPFLFKCEGEGFWTRKQLGAAWKRHRKTNRNLEELDRADLTIHGLRAHACVELLRGGANTRQIADMVGMSEPMVKNYTRFSDQRDNAIAAVHLLNDKRRAMAS